MADIASIGVKFDGTDLERGIRLLTALEAHGLRLEQSMGRIEGAAARTGRTLATLGQGVNLGGVNSASASAAAGIDRLGQSAAQAAASVGALGAASGAAQGGLNRTAQGANNSAEAMRAASASANVLTNVMSGLAAGFGASQLIRCAANPAVQGRVKSADGKAVLVGWIGFNAASATAAVRCTGE